MAADHSAAGTDAPSSDLLVQEFAQLPVRPGVGMQLLWMLDDENSSAAMLGALIETDPALSTRMIRLANSSYYGMRGSVSSAQRAVVVVGISTVRAIGTSAMFDLFAEKGRAVPEDFWSHSLATAAAASTLAGRSGVNPSDAFSTGLLLDLGGALMFRRARRRYDTVLERVANGEALLLEAELEEYQIGHAQVGAAALELMGFPSDTVTAVRHHHDLLGADAPTLARICAAADVLAHLIEGTTQESETAFSDVLGSFGIDEEMMPALRDEVTLHVEALTGFMSV